MLRDALERRTSFDFDEEFGSEDRLTQAVTIFALLDLYSKGEVTWEQAENFGPIRVKRGDRDGGGVNDLSRTVEALLFLSPDPVASPTSPRRRRRPRARSPRRSSCSAKTSPRASAGSCCG